ncbi:MULTISPECIES: hypothetical protein [Pseudoalteromonas]|uniref:Uncharacterized protein n=1 Tax=Pseudoalteromonas obscura TaxID=3048491 RepID=A0ABT7EMD2_9GAMM|nr:MULTISPECIES: hypothetical protein [Pseudoalteromonas]MBQ4837849.1 hypothetical protein [Pseudoalteromonas luteoviolacea]MDK2596206.1 hypothetical protein [Pseudoalteromonas sp. P94(2023)]
MKLRKLASGSLIGVTALIMHFSSVAGESNVNTNDVPSNVDYYQDVGKYVTKVGELSPHDRQEIQASYWERMNGNGSGWYATNGGIRAVYGAGGSDRSVEQFLADTYGSVPWYWATTATVKVQMDGNGSKAYRCPRNHLVTELYYADSGDDSVEALRCKAMRSHSTGSETAVRVPYTGVAYCPSDYYLTGMRYKDYGDDYVEEIICSKVY